MFLTISEIIIGHLTTLQRLLGKNIIRLSSYVLITPTILKLEKSLLQHFKAFVQ